MKYIFFIPILLSMWCSIALSHPAKVIVPAGKNISDVNKLSNTALDHRNAQAEDNFKEREALRRMNMLERLILDVNRQKEHSRDQILGSPFFNPGAYRMESKEPPSLKPKSAFIAIPFASKIEGFQFLKPSAITRE